MFCPLSIFSSWFSCEIVFFSLNLHNTPYLPYSPFKKCILLCFIMTVLKLFTSQEHILLKRRGSIACVSGLPILLAECHVHSSYSINWSNWMLKESSNLTKTGAKSLDTKHIFHQLCRLFLLEIWILLRIKEIIFHIVLSKIFQKKTY